MGRGAGTEQGRQVSKHHYAYADGVRPEKTCLERELFSMRLQAREAKAQEHSEGNNS